jgi:MFS family permease
MNAIAAYSTERLADVFGWGVAYEVAGGFTLLAFALTSSIPPVRADTAFEPAPTSASAPGSTGGVTVAALAAGAAFATIATFTQPFVISLGATDVAPLFIGYTATALIVRLGFGSYMDRWGRRRTALWSLSLYAVAVLAAALVRPSLLFPFGLVFGAAHGVLWPSINALAVERAEAGRSGSALTRLHAMFGVGAMGAVWGIGWLVGAIGYSLSFVIAAVFVACGAATLHKRATALTPIQ